VLVGGALAVSGSIFQTVTRNPLASPDILGVTGAAGLGAAYAILVQSASGPTVAVFAGVAALIAAAAGYLLSWRGGTNGYRVILIGIGVAAIGSALTSWLLTVRQALEAQRALIWITGSLNDVSVPELACLAAICAAALVVVPFAQHWLALLELGDETATGLGLRPERARAAAVLIGVVLAAAAVAVAGPLSFIALVAPPLARRLARGPGVVPLLSAVVGALLVLGSDTIGHYLLGNQPVGVVTGIVGAPYLIYLLTRSSTLARA
jgi:iron complex transport system permease protein